MYKEKLDLFLIIFKNGIMFQSITDLGRTLLSFFTEGFFTDYFKAKAELY